MYGALGADDGGKELGDVNTEKDEGDQGGEELDYADGGEQVGVERVGGYGFRDRGDDAEHGEDCGES